MDQTGEFVQEKNCYSNPYKAYLCLFTALGTYLSINSEKLEGKETLFVNPGSKFKTAAQTFACQVDEIGKRHAQQQISK
jgi:hypothetical protein